MHLQFAAHFWERRRSCRPAYDPNICAKATVAFAKCQAVSWTEISPWRGLHANPAALASQQKRMNYSPLFTQLPLSACAANALYWLHLPLSEKSLSVCPGGQVNDICKHTIYVFLIYVFMCTQKRGVYYWAGRRTRASICSERRVAMHYAECGTESN